MKTFAPNSAKRSLTSVSAIASAGVIGTALSNDDDLAIRLMVEKDTKSYLVTGSSDTYSFPVLEPVNMAPEVTLAEYKDADKHSLAKLMYSVNRNRATKTEVLEYNTNLSPLKRLKILRAIFEYTDKHKDDKNLTFTKLNPLNIKVYIDENLNFFQRAGKRVANPGGKIDIRVECPTFQRDVTPVSVYDEHPAISSLFLQVLGVSLDCNGFAIMPDRVRDIKKVTDPGYSSTFGVPPMSVVAADPDARKKDIDCAYNRIVDLPFCVSSQDRIATFVRSYNFMMLQRYFKAAKVSKNHLFVKYIIVSCKKMKSNLRWNHVSNFISNYHKRSTNTIGEIVMEANAWRTLIDGCIKAIIETRNRNRLNFALGASVASAGGALIYGLASLPFDGVGPDAADQSYASTTGAGESNEVPEHHPPTDANVNGVSEHHSRVDTGAANGIRQDSTPAAAGSMNNGLAGTQGPSKGDANLAIDATQGSEVLSRSRRDVGEYDYLDSDENFANLVNALNFGPSFGSPVNDMFANLAHEMSYGYNFDDTGAFDMDISHETGGWSNFDDLNPSYNDTNVTDTSHGLESRSHQLDLDLHSNNVNVNFEDVAHEIGGWSNFDDLDPSHDDANVTDTTHEIQSTSNHNPNPPSSNVNVNLKDIAHEIGGGSNFDDVDHHHASTDPVTPSNTDNNPVAAYAMNGENYYESQAYRDDMAQFYGQSQYQHLIDYYSATRWGPPV